MSRGGTFDTSRSSSFSVLASGNGSAIEIRPDRSSSTTVSLLGTDDLQAPQINSSGLSLPDFTLFTPTASNPPQDALGLGLNSTFLRHLMASRQIASRTWSLFWGLKGGSSAAQMDGSLVIGGCDAAKTTGNNLTSEFTRDGSCPWSCPNSLIVDLNDITLKFTNGTTVSLFGSSQGTAMRSCIKPDIPLITFPSSVWNTFTTLAGGAFIAPSESYKLWGMDFVADGAFDGDLSFTLSSGVEITVPNSQLVVPDVTVSAEGDLQITNNSLREILIYNLEDDNANDMPLLGQAFLTSAYLHVNNDAKQFTLWQARPTTETKLVPVVTDLTYCSNHSSPSAPATSVAPTKQRPSGNSLSIGAVVGVAVASIAATTLVFVVTFRAWSRKRSSPLLSPLPREPTYDTYKEAVVEIAESGDDGPPLRVRQSTVRELTSAPLYEMPSEPFRRSASGDDLVSTRGNSV